MARAERTHRRLKETALRLFAERGFDDVTVEEIARAADVSHMTFFRHFPTKESVVLDDPYDPLIGEAIALQETDVPSLERVRRGFFAAWDSINEPGDDETRARLRLAAGHPGLRAKVWENNQATEVVIVEALKDGGASELEARIAAGAVLGALTAALFDWAGDPAAGSLGGRIREALHYLEIPSTETGL